MTTLAGVQVGRTISQRQVLRDPVHKIEVGGIMAADAADGSNTGYTDRIRGGWLLGQDSTTKEWYPLKLTSVNGSGESSSVAGDKTTFAVDNAAAFVVGDVVSVINNSSLAVVESGLVITAIVYGTNRITVGDPVNVTDNYLVRAEDGSGVPRGILLDDEVYLRNADNTATEAKHIRILAHGFIKSSMILGDLTTARAVTNYLGNILFDSDFGY